MSTDGGCEDEEIADMSTPAVLFVILQSGAAANGGVASISQVIAGLRHHRPIVLTDRETPRVEEWRRADIETHVHPQTVSTGFFRNPVAAIRSYWRYTREIRRLIASSGAKIVHANSPLALQLAVAAAKLSGIKLVLNMRGTAATYRLQSRLRYRLLFAAADHILYLSNDMVHRWRKHVPNAASSFSVTYSAVDPAQFHPRPVDSGNEAIVLVSALIRPLKGQLEFIRHVVPTLADSGRKTWFVGDCEPGREDYLADCAEAAAPFGNSVRFLGYRTDVPELIARASVVAVPSRHEGLVRSMIEAMSCARPVVSFDVCSAREMLEQESGGAGIVVECGDYESMARAILRYCCNPKEAERAGVRGHSTASRLFAPDAVVSRYERAYQLLRLEGPKIEGLTYVG